MSTLKLLPPPRPSAADRTLLPAALTALLAAGLVVLVMLPSTAPLPEGQAVAPLRLPPLNDPAVWSDPIIVQQTLFSPTRRSDGAAASPGTGAAAAEPLGGARIAGIAISPGRTRVFVMAPDGTVAALAPGAIYHGWRLVGANPAEVRFARGSERLDLAAGAAAARTKPVEATDETAEENPL